MGIRARQAFLTGLGLASALLLVWAPAPARAFSSIAWGVEPGRLRPSSLCGVPGYIHREITVAALRPLGFADAALRPICWANFRTDVGQYGLAWPPLWIGPNATYAPGDHFDRNEGEGDRQAFTRGLAALAAHRQMAVDALRRGDREAAYEALGHSLHGVQDFFAHSDYVDLHASEQQVLLALVSGARPVPSGVKSPRLVGSAGGSLEDIPGDAYGHDAHSKDGYAVTSSPNAPGWRAPKYPEAWQRLRGRTKHEWAVAAATEASRRYTLALAAALPPDRWRAWLKGSPLR